MFKFCNTIRISLRLQGFSVVQLSRDAATVAQRQGATPLAVHTKTLIGFHTTKNILLWNASFPIISARVAVLLWGKNCVC